MASSVEFSVRGPILRPLYPLPRVLHPRKSVCSKELVLSNSSWLYSFCQWKLAAIHIRHLKDQRIEAEKTAHPCYCLTWAAVFLFIVSFHGWNENLFQTQVKWRQIFKWNFIEISPKFLMLEHSTTFSTEKFSVTTIHSPYNLMDIHHVSQIHLSLVGLFERLVYWFLKRGERRGRVKHQLAASNTNPTKDRACTPGMCPDTESNRQPFSAQDKAQPTEPH